MAYEKVNINFEELLKRGKAHRCAALLENNSIPYDSLGRALGISTNYSRALVLGTQHLAPHNQKRLDAVADYLEKLDAPKRKARKLGKS